MFYRDGNEQSVAGTVRVGENEVAKMRCERLGWDEVGMRVMWGLLSQCKDFIFSSGQDLKPQEGSE